MGWMFGVNRDGREVGYGVEATCDEPGCTTKIDRGISYVCGGMHDGGEFGCGRYFCGKHLYGQGLCIRDRERNTCPICEGDGVLPDESECEACDGTGEQGLVW